MNYIFRSIILIFLTLMSCYTYYVGYLKPGTATVTDSDRRAYLIENDEFDIKMMGMIWNGSIELTLNFVLNRNLNFSSPSVKIISHSDSVLCTLTQYPTSAYEHYLKAGDVANIKYSGFIDNFYTRRDSLAKEKYYIEIYDLKNLINDSLINVPKIPVLIEWLQPESKDES